MKQSIFLLLILTLSLGCENGEPTFEQGRLATAQTRTSNPGAFSILDGMIVFPTYDDLEQTLGFIASSVNENRLSWENAVSIETSGKAYTNFINELENINDDDEAAIAALEENYINKIKIVLGPDYTKLHIPKYTFFNDLVNLNGLFKVENIIYKVSNHKLISANLAVFNGDINSLGDNTVTSEENGLYVADIVSFTQPECNCNSWSKKQCYFENGSGRRFTIDLQVNASHIKRTLMGGQTTRITIMTDGYLETIHDKKGWLGNWYGKRCNSTLTHSLFGNISVPEYNEIFNISTNPTPFIQSVTNRMYNSVRSSSTVVGVIMGDNRNFKVDLCVDWYATKIDRTGWYFCKDDCIL